MAVKLVHKYNDRGAHRIEVDGLDNDAQPAWWTGYSNPAFLTYEGHCYVVFPGYLLGLKGEQPIHDGPYANTIYKLEEYTPS